MQEKIELPLYALPTDLLQKIILEDMTNEYFHYILRRSFLRGEETKKDEAIAHSRRIFNANLWERLVERDFSYLYPEAKKNAPVFEALENASEEEVKENQEKHKEECRIFWKNTYLKLNTSVYKNIEEKNKKLLKLLALGDLQSFKGILNSISEENAKICFIENFIATLENSKSPVLIANFKKNPDCLAYLYEVITKFHGKPSNTWAAICGQVSKIDSDALKDEEDLKSTLLYATRFGHRKIIEKIAYQENIPSKMLGEALCVAVS